MMLGLLLLSLPASWAILLLCYSRPLLARWREPVLRYPVLVLESDDWGAGPRSQSDALATIADTLCRHRDACGAPAVMTLGLVLACPRATAARESDLETLLAPSQAGVLDAIRAGIRQGVFSPQLHGLCHFEPTVLTRAEVAWPEACEDVWTETMPDALQSALIDASELPSRPLAAGVVEGSVRQQADLWYEIFGERPAVAVPTTFIWTDVAERAWRNTGVQYLVTPGRRATRRDGQGQPSGIDRHFLTGQTTESGLTCLVRDVYFEPARGHHPESVLAEVNYRFALGRPALIEIHRSNFVGPAAAPDSLARLETLLQQVRKTCANVRFVSTADLGQVLVARHPDWVVQSLRLRLAVFLRRIHEIPRFARLARYSALFGVLALVMRAAR